MPSPLSQRTYMPAIFIALLAILAGIWQWMAAQERSTILARYQEITENQATTKKLSLENEIKRLSDMVNFLARIPTTLALAGALPDTDSDDELKHHLQITFQEYCITDPNISQVRLIGKADNGKELVRLDCDKAGKIIVPEAQLQQKGNRDYFIATLKTPPGNIYVSPINLNREHGQVEMPPKPTVRVATQVSGPDQTPFGIVVINYNLGRYLQQLAQNLPGDITVYLTNADGDFIMHPDANKQFAFEFGRHYRWQDAFGTPTGYTGKFTNYHIGKDEVHVLTTTLELQPGNPQSRYTLELAFPDNLIKKSVLHQLLYSLLFLAPAVLAFLLILYLLRKNQQRERQVTTKQAELAAIVQNSSEAIISQNMNGIVTSWNHAAEDMFGFPAAVAIGKTVRELVVPEELGGEEDKILSTISEGRKVLPFDSVRRRQDNSTFPATIVASPITSPDGKVLGAAKIVRDITLQRETEAKILALNSSLEQQVESRTQDLQKRNRELELVRDSFIQVTEASPFGLMVVSNEGEIEQVNPKAEEIFGYTRDELVGHTVEILIPRQSRSNHPELRHSYTKSPSKRDMSNRPDLTALHKDGSTFPIQISLNTISTPEGKKIVAAIQDVSTKRAAERERQRLTSILELTPDFIGIADMEGNLKYHNQAALDLLGLPADTNLFNMHIRDMHPEHGAKRVMEEAIPAVLKQGVWHGENVLRHSDGREIPVTQVVILHRDSHGNPEFLSTIMRDITEQKQREKELNQARSDAEKANRAKSSFIANMSHEIRTPLNAVLGMMQLIRRTELNPRQQEYVEKSEAAAKSLLYILNDILDYSKVEAEKMTLDPQPCCFSDFLQNVGSILSANINKADLEVLFDIDPKLPPCMVFDSLRLQQILINLAGNAIKFTEQGAVVLSVKVLEHKDNAVNVHFSITDTGIGIAPQNWSKIFEGFTQAETTTTRRFGGTGLGLAISQRLVQMMGGELDGKSTLGEGSTFYFDLTLPVAADIKRESFQNLGNLNVLIVDDNPIALEILEKTVQGMGWKTTVAHDGATALSLLRSPQSSAHPFDLVLMDWSMPGQNGFEICKQIRQQLDAKQSPIIVMVTAHGREILETGRANDLNVLDGFLIKPVAAAMIFNAVADARRTAGQLASPEPGDIDSESRPLSNLTILLVEDNATNQQVASELLQEVGAHVRTANNGQIAVDMLKDKSQSCDLVLMDVQMPVMDGYAATWEIRTRLGLQQLPIIAMTANAMNEDRDAALESGMNDHIGKPFELNDLVNIILKWCPHATALPMRHPKSIDTSPPPKSLLDTEEALRRFSGKKKIYLKALEGFVRETPILLAELEDAYQHKQRDAAVRHLHTLKGMAGTVGAGLMQEICASTEALVRNENNWNSQSKPLAHVKSIATETLAATEALNTDMQESVFAKEPSHDSQTAPITRLMELSDLLSSSNLQALTLFETIREQFGNSPPPYILGIESALEQLDFDLANQVCTDFLAGLKGKSA